MEAGGEGGQHWSEAASQKRVASTSSIDREWRCGKRQLPFEAEMEGAELLKNYLRSDNQACYLTALESTRIRIRASSA